MANRVEHVCPHCGRDDFASANGLRQHMERNPVCGHIARYGVPIPPANVGNPQANLPSNNRRSGWSRMANQNRESRQMDGLQQIEDDDSSSSSDDKASAMMMMEDDDDSSFEHYEDCVKVPDIRHEEDLAVNLDTDTEVNADHVKQFVEHSSG